MKIRTLALTAIALSAATAFATTSPATDRARRLAEVVAHMESQYPGEVVAIAFDGSGDKGAHYHVDMRFAASGLARLDVDAATLAIEAREASAPLAGSASLAEAVSLLAAHVPGQVVVAELDTSYGAAPHYDVDILLPQGAVARLKLDPATRQIAWRNPPVIGE